MLLESVSDASSGCFSREAQAWWCAEFLFTYLTSPKAAGKSAAMAPPNRSTCLNVDIFVCRVAVNSILLSFLLPLKRIQSIFLGFPWNKCREKSSVSRNDRR